MCAINTVNYASQSTVRLCKCAYCTSPWCTCPALLPDSVPSPLLRFMFSRTRPAVTVINSVVVRGAPGPLPAPTADSSVCAPPPFSLFLLETNDLISAITLWPPSIITACCLALSSPRRRLLPLSHLISCFLHTLLHYRSESRAARAWCLFWSMLFFFFSVQQEPRLPAVWSTDNSCRSRDNSLYFHSFLVWQDGSHD